MHRLVLLAALLAPGALARASGEAPRLICGIWPDRILFFDQTTDAFSEAFRVRHGAITASAHTPDRSLFFVVTDRMQAVEVLDPLRGEVVDEVALSTPERRVWIHRVFPNHAGTKVYLYVSVIRLEPDRLVYEDDYNVVHYDLEKDEAIRTFALSEELLSGGRPSLWVSPDEETFFAFGDDIHEVDAESQEIVDTLVLSKPLHPGYGALRGVGLTETSEPGLFYGIYRTEDPVQEKALFGLAKIDLGTRSVETFELGPSLDVGRGFALAPDGARGYAGLGDLVVVDMAANRVLRKKEGFERGRTNTSLIVSADGTRLYVSGVGDTMYVYDAETLELVKTVFAGGDFMMPAVEMASPGASRSGAGN